VSGQTEKLAWLQSGRPLAAATLVERSGSAPFEPGATMLVDAESAVLGSVSGGCVEMALVEEAQRVLAGGEPRLLSYGISDELAGEVGLSCGGTIGVLVHALDGSSRAAMAAALRAEREGRPVVLATRLDGPRAGARLCLDRERALGTLAGGSVLDRRAQREAEPLLELGGGGIRELPREAECGDLDPEPARVHLRSHVAKPKLVLFGAVDFSLALAELGAAVGFEAILCEARRAFAESARPAAGVELFRGWPEELFAARELGPRDAVLAMTHDPKFDEPALRGALASGAGYVGALGSRRTQALRAERLREAGLDEAELARIHGPCGLDIGAATPAETAVSILAEIIATRSGRPGAPLTAGADPIHAGSHPR
jgi:xanthine dehydrogenase accessory factor